MRILQPRNGTFVFPVPILSSRLLVSLSPCFLVSSLGALTLAAGIGFFIWYRATAPAPPAVELTGVDPAIAAAVERARAAISGSPRSAPAWGRLGMVLLTHNFTAEAKVCLAQAERLDPHKPRWPYHHGIALLEDDTEKAILKLQRAVALCGDTVVAVRARLAEALLGQDRLDEADIHFRRVLQLQPGDPRALLGLSRMAHRRGDLQESLNYAQRCLHEEGARKSSHLLLAEIYQRLGDKKAADQQSRQAALLRDDPLWPDPFLQELLDLRTGERANIKRAQKLLDLGRVPQAVTLLQQMVSDYPDSATCWLMLGRALVHQQNWPAAEQALNKALELAPDNPEIHVQMGVALYYQWNPRAADHFRKAIQIQPDCAPAYYNLGLWLVRIHDRAGAIDAFRRAIRTQPNLTDAYLGLGSQLALQGHIAEAVQHLQRAVELNPADPRARQLLRQALQQVAVPILP
jgi:tetratricopeptide (TPR) repeat protein